MKRHLLLLCLLFSFAPPVSTSQLRAVPQSGDPALDGKDYLLTGSDFRALLVVARNRLRAKPWFRIHRVHVLTASKVEAYFGPEDEVGSGTFQLERIRGTWRITAEDSVRVIFDH